MSEQKWIYYFQVRGSSVAKVNTDVFEVAMINMGFLRCSYAEYLRKRKLIREQEQIINIKGKVSDGKQTK